MAWTFWRCARLALVVLLSFSAAARAESKTIARCGAGFLEDIDGARVLHVSGTPYEMGYQHGVLLKDEIHAMVRFLFDVKAKEFSEQLQLDLGNGLLKLKPDAKAIIGTITAIQKKHIPPAHLEEIRGVADGANIDYDEILRANFIPELFHCSGFALSGKATKDGTLYHGRVLDYGCDWRLQEHAVVMIAKPNGKIPFVNITYSGFVGSVTGMNAKQVAIGEMGGRGLGKWNGTPMALLFRLALEEADDLDEAVAIFRDRPRTCQYYYVISDGKTGRAVGMEASHDAFGLVQMGESHPLLPHAVDDAVLLSAGERYELLVERVKQGYGTFNADSALRLMDRPVAMKSNLHNVLFEPKSTRFWVAHASKDAEPAATQPYQAFQLTELLQHQPSGAYRTLPAPPSAPPIAVEAAAAR
jgi:isopenicillin-N N-acyltransferase-like protein